MAIFFKKISRYNFSIFTTSIQCGRQQSFGRLLILNKIGQQWSQFKLWKLKFLLIIQFCYSFLIEKFLRWVHFHISSFSSCIYIDMCTSHKSCFNQFPRRFYTHICTESNNLKVHDIVSTKNTNGVKILYKKMRKKVGKYRFLF